MNFSIANHNDAKNPKGFINYEDVEFLNIPEMTTSGFAYSAGKFKDGHRNNDNWLGYEDVLILDIDDGCTIIQAIEIFKRYENFIITSRSHQKNKNGLVCDRFRIFIHLEETINDKTLRDKFMLQSMDTFCFVDKSAKDRGRFFFSSPTDAKVIYNNGKKMPIIITEIAIEDKKDTKSMIIPGNDIYRLCEIRECWIDKNGNVLENNVTENGLNIDAKLKGAISLLDKEFYKGNRNHAIFKACTMLLKDGISNDDVADFIIKENETRDSVPFKELMAIIKSAIRTV